MKNVCLLIYTVAAQFSSVRGICLHWNATNDNVFLKCQVFSYVSIESEIQLMDSNDQIRVKCSFNESSYCVAKEEGDIVFGEASTNGFRLVLQTTKKDVKGDWKCFHGSEKAIIHIDISKGIVYPADIHLSGEIRSHSKITLTCYSCWIPDTESVYFFVNNVLEDVVRLHKGKCYRKRKACSQTECTCSTEGNYFTWSFTSDLPDLEFSCEMRFKDEKTSQLSIHTANLYYNETEFQQKMKTIRNIPVSDKDIYINGGTDKETLIYLGIVTLISTVSANLIIIGIAFGCIVLRKITAPGKCCLYQRVPREDAEMQSSPGAELEIVRFCCMCRYTTACEICIDCKTFYCDTCCEFHIQYEPAHRVCQIEHTSISQNETLCGKCKKIASKICIVRDCYKLRCQSCNHKHEAKYMMRIYQNKSTFRTKTIAEVKHELSYVERVSFQDDVHPVRIYGLGYIEGDTLVALDGNNHKLIVFTPNQEQFKKQFGDEPCAITIMTNRTIAITFPYIKWIRIYDINLKAKELTESEQSFSMETLGIPKWKPFNIAYNQDCFAIEVGEREDGKIVIVDITKKKIRNTIECSSAYFTGHTIRLALDINNELIFVSAMGKRMVTCMNFKSELMWNIPNASPRSILILEDTIILCSRRCNAIYALEKENGKSVVLAGNISNPRFIAHRSSDNQLCVHVKNDKNKDALDFYKLKVHDHSSQKTKLLPKKVNKQGDLILALDDIYKI